MPYYEASAFTGQGVTEFFEGGAYKFLENKMMKEYGLETLQDRIKIE